MGFEQLSKNYFSLSGQTCGNSKKMPLNINTAHLLWIFKNLLAVNTDFYHEVLKMVHQDQDFHGNWNLL